MSKLEGKIAVITGGNSGIGLATAQRFVAEGAYVFITGRRQSELDAAVKQLGKSVTAVQGDVSNLADLDRLYAAVKKQKSHIDTWRNHGRALRQDFSMPTSRAFCSPCKKRFRS
jgi:NAD(P)-dependent dehydrogenase (short-subunit alcohol dehydrogenase family)